MREQLSAQERKQRDMAYAKELEQIIQEDSRVEVRYKESRPITDLKDMIQTSASEEWYRDHVAFYQKFKKGGEYTSITYKEALETMNKLGTALIDLGLKDKRIGVIGENSYYWAISYLATVCGTGVVVPLDKELSGRDLRQLVVQGEVHAVIYQDKYESIFTEAVKSGETVIKYLINMDKEEDGDGILSWKKLVERGGELLKQGNRDFLDAIIDSEALSVLLFTSGTTGVSKGVMLSHRNLVTVLMIAPTVLKVYDWDIFFSVLPVHHTYEATCGFLMPLYKGAAVAYCEGLKHIVKNLGEIKPTMFLGVPALFETLYKKIWKGIRDKGKEDTVKKVIALNRKTKKVGIDLGNIFFKEIRNILGGRMRMMIAGGAAINPDVLEGLQDFGIMAVQGYGMTECAPLGALNPDKNPKSNAIGTHFPGCELKIVDKNEEGIGELCVKGGNVMIGYYNMPEATREMVVDGWLHTGDLGYMDQDGYVVLTGRKKNVIITKNGKNVYPEELEYHLVNELAILESMVFEDKRESREDTLIVASLIMDLEALEEKWGRSLSPEELEEEAWKAVDRVNEEQAAYKKIKKIIIRKEDFIKNTSKKIIRFDERNKR